MKDEIVTYETAKLAKKVGFDILSPYCYDKKGMIQLFSAKNSDLDFGYSAPTQSLLQRWIREEHKINIFITEGFHVMSKYKVYTNPSWGMFEEYYSYEESLERGLFEALKLIENER